LLTQRTFSPRDFAETRQGACRMTQHLAASLAETCPAWRRETAPIVERVAHTLSRHSPARLPHLTPLTGSNWKSAWDERNPHRTQRQPWTGGLALPNTCRDCGGELPTRRHRYCDGCRARRWSESAPRGRQNAQRVLAGLRADQRDPGRGGRAAELRGSKNAAHQRVVKAWTGEHTDPAQFADEILPGLQAASIAVIAKATGLSEHYCSLIRLGKRVPHPRHWGAFAAVTAPDHRIVTGRPAR
jgi:hypothetical protein